MLGHYLRYMLYSKPHIFIGGLMMRKVDLRMNELKKYEIIKKLVETNGNKKRAAIKLGCSLRTVTVSYTHLDVYKRQIFSICFTN